MVVRMTDSRDEELFLDDDEDQSSDHFKDFAPERVPPVVTERGRGLGRADRALADGELTAPASSSEGVEQPP